MTKLCSKSVAGRDCNPKIKMTRFETDSKIENELRDAIVL
jgi:hypothetical protein